MTKESEKLKGEALFSDVEEHRAEFNGNGDALCMAAGYGIKGSDGIEKCNFSDFIEALSGAFQK